MKRSLYITEITKTVVWIIVGIMFVYLIAQGIEYYEDEESKQTQPKIIYHYHFHMPTPQIQPQALINKKEVELLARLIYSEAGIESAACKYAVANVVMNRLEHPNYPNDLFNVIHQKGQFSVIADNSFYDKEPSKLSYQIARDVLNNNVRVIPKNILFFKAEYSKANWGTESFKIDRTEFYASIK